jgi:hypothetical protein
LRLLDGELDLPLPAKTGYPCLFHRFEENGCDVIHGVDLVVQGCLSLQYTAPRKLHLS